MNTVSSIVSNVPKSNKLSVLNPLPLPKEITEGVFEPSKEPTSVIDNRRYKQDTMLENSFANRMRINISKTFDIPLVHFPRGLKGASDFTFFEFLQTAKFPYYVGGPILAGLFYAGVKKDNLKSAKAASTVAKHMALGVAFYYIGAALAKSVINSTVKLFRGMDLKHPYAAAVAASPNKSGTYQREVEYHTMFESVDFLRSDLLYNHEGKTPAEINDNYVKLGKKFGVKGATNDVDQTLIPLMKKTIVMARAWQYALTALYVSLGIGLANQPAWGKSSSPEGLKYTLKYGVFDKNVSFRHRKENIKQILKDYIVEPFAKSCKELWQGHNKATSIIGKSVILSSLGATALAISLILTKTSAKSHSIPPISKSSQEAK